MVNHQPEDFRALLCTRILDQSAFVKATFSGRQRGTSLAWKRVTVRPVLIRGKRHLQFSHFDEKQDITKNFSGRAAEVKLNEILALPFKNFSVQTLSEDIQVQISKKGKINVQRRPVVGRVQPHLVHDQPKELLLPDGKPDPFLQQLGIMTQDGRVRVRARKKFRQINEFLARLVESGELEQFAETGPLQIVDCGCGSAHLTFAVFHYLTHLLGREAQMVGIDVNQELIAQRAALSQELGWAGLSFEAVPILEYRPATQPDIVLALHACDTATDDALAQAVRWGSEMILVAPCCHHHLQQQLADGPAPAQFAPLLRHGLLRERLGDLLTDGFRAQLLRVLGYRVDVVEFVSLEHTGKNLMLRAVRSRKPGDSRAVADYRNLRDYWRVRPYLETLLENELAEWTHEKET